DLDTLPELLQKHAMVWVNVNGLGNAEELRRIAELFELHPLVLEDVVDVHQRPKAETYDDQLFAVARMPVTDPEFPSEQISLVIGPGWVVSFQERPGDCFDPVRHRIRTGRPRITNAGADYLGYALLDAIVDAFFPVVDGLGDRLEELEEQVLADGSAPVVAELHQLKRHLARLRRVLLPQREALGSLARGDSDLIAEETRMFLRDAQDHAVQLIELVEGQRDIASGILDLHLTMVSNRMNDIMKVLTIIATIFIPLGFIAGLYGMNFDPGISRWNMPELGWTFGYPFALVLMGLVAGGLVIFFRRKGWF
ncbi:MAG: magnesium/cobalt transporter CorA, partial [Gemmatimonadetes bacterium]|nr:magnesium/cobalt transporter CorA [Gemmatimonadota bacterium]